MIHTKNLQQPAMGWWKAGSEPPSDDPAELKRAMGRIGEPFALLNMNGRFGVGRGGEAELHLSRNGAQGSQSARPSGTYELLALAPSCRPEMLGDPSFREDHGLRYPYIAGAMANGVGSADIVEAMGRAGMIGFFGAAGLPLDRIEAAIDRIQNNLGASEGSLPFGFNLIHSPHETALEAGVVDLYLRRGVRLVSASAYLNLTLPLIRYRVHGLARDGAGRVIAPNRIIAKVSRIEVARRFFSPPPEKLLQALVETGEITADQALMAEEIPVAQDLTAEADSGGHTDNRPFVTLLPTLLALRDELQSQFGYAQRLRVGAGGGIGTPTAAAAAFSMGAAYILTGSINQACVESGSSDLVRGLLCSARQADVAMAPAADMFEMGVKVQVLKRGTMFAMRATKLYEIYRAHASLDAIPSDQRAALEKDIFGDSLQQIWDQTRQFFLQRDPTQIERAANDPKHRMALVFRWYLGQSSNWANAGVAERQMDYQIWCGPAMGAFNEWVKGSFLEPQPERKVVTVAWNLLVGASILTRIQNLRSQGIHFPPEILSSGPLRLQELKERLN